MGFLKPSLLKCEQPAVVSLHAIEMTQQVFGEGRAAVISEKPREPLHRLDIFRQGVGLLVGDHLQPVLDPPQERVGRGELVARLEGDPVARRQNIQRLERRAYAQFGMPSARDQLLGLREEFDLANAAASNLDVMTFHGDLALPTEGLHLPLHVMHVGQRSEIEMLAPDEGCDLRDQRVAGFRIAGAGPRLDHRSALPGSAFPLIIVQR